MSARSRDAAAGAVSAYRRLAANTAAAFAGRLAAIALALLLSTVLFRTLGAARYGIWSFCYMLVGFLTLFDLGLAATVERLVAQAHSAGERAALERVVNHGAGCALVIAAGIQVAAALTPLDSVAGENVRPLAWVLPSCMLVSLLAAITGAGLSGIQSLARLNVIRTTMNVVSTIAVLLALAFGVRRLEILLLAYSTGLAGAALMGWTSLERAVGAMRFAPYRFDRELMKEFVRFGGVVQVAIFGPQLTEQVFRVLVGVRFGAAWMGCYDLGSRAAVVVRSFTGTLLLAIVPFGVQQQFEGGQPAVERLHRVTLKYTSLLLLPASALVLYHSQLLISLWLGGSPEAGNVLFVFRLFVVTHAAAGLAGPIQMLARAAGIPVIEAGVSLAMSALGLAVAVLAPGVHAVLAGFGATAVLSAALLWWRLRARGVGARRTGDTVVRSAAVAAAALAISWFLSLLLPDPGPSFWRQALVGTVSLGVPLAAVFPIAWSSGVLTRAERDFWKGLTPGRFRLPAVAVTPAAAQGGDASGGER